MAIWNNNNQANKLRYSGTQPTDVPLTVAFRAYEVAAKASFQCLFSRNFTAGGDPDLYIGLNGDRILTYINASTGTTTAATSFSQAIRRPYHFAYSHDSSNVCNVYQDGARIGGFTSAPGGGATTNYEIHGNTPNEEGNHAIWDLRIWTAALTQAEILAEMASPMRPV